MSRLLLISVQSSKREHGTLAQKLLVLGATMSASLSSPGFLDLRAADTLVAVHAAIGERPRILYAGPDLPGALPQSLMRMRERSHAPGGPETPIDASFLNTIGTGFPAPPGLLAHRAGQDWAIDLRVERAEQRGPEALLITASDAHCGVTVNHMISVESASGVVQFGAHIINSGDAPLALEWLAAICLPIDERLTKITHFTGQWAGEFQTQTKALAHDLSRGAFLKENRSGRTGHQSYPGIYCGTAQTSETHGPAAAFQLAASANHRMRVDRLDDDTVTIQAGDLLLPGEIILQPGEHHIPAPLFASWSSKGYGDLTRRLHHFVRGSLLKTRPERPVHYNTWEAVYFDHQPQKLIELAEHAASVGAERFVLDDGWFGARRSDKAGLGDWFVADEIYPDGLKPLADHVRQLGMEFGLWFEPEMVNPDSELYRAHPDWVLSAPNLEPIPSRGQLPLDLTRDEVCDYLFERITGLIKDIGIAYIKWDMNRDIQHPGGRDKRPVMHAQMAALCTLINRIKAACPDLVIESCSSGGARADYNMVERTGRIWPSDNNDARARHAIMRGAAYFLPLSVLGNHVGPERCHITGRRFDMHFRAGTAVFGHMGMELDLALESEADKAVLAEAIALHKAHRPLIHEGQYHRLESAPHINAIGSVADNQAEALFQIAILDQHPAPHPPLIRFAGLDPEAPYTLNQLWPPQHSGTGKTAQPAQSFAGSALMEYGLQMPRTNPDTCLIYHLERLS